MPWATESAGGLTVHDVVAAGHVLLHGDLAVAVLLVQFSQLPCPEPLRSRRRRGSRGRAGRSRVLLRLGRVGPVFGTVLIGDLPLLPGWSTGAAGARLTRVRLIRVLLTLVRLVRAGLREWRVLLIRILLTLVLLTGVRLVQGRKFVPAALGEPEPAAEIVLLRITVPRPVVRAAGTDGCPARIAPPPALS